MTDHPTAGEVPPATAVASAGDRLRAAREAAGLSLTEVSARTRIPARQLEAVEAGRYAALPSPTYAVGFAKAYARAVGADEVGIAAAVRDEIGRVGVRQPEYEPYELPDPARVPSRGLAIVAAGVALAVVILVGLWYGTDLFRRGTTGAPAAVQQQVAAAPTPTRPAAAPVVPTDGQVRITATGRVWLRVYDRDDKTLYLGTMDPGDHFDVPRDAKGPMISIGRPDKIAVTLDGRAVPPLGASAHAIKDVHVDGAAIAARLAEPSAAATPAATATPAADAAPAERRSEDRPRRSDDRPRRERRVERAPLTETQRANLDAARAAPAAGNSQ